MVITISVRQNQKMDPAFFDNYLLQASVNLNENCKNIQAEGAAAATWDATDSCFIILWQDRKRKS